MMSEAVWIPYIEVETNAGIREVSLTTRHLMNRRVFLFGKITAEAANQIVSQLLYLSEEDTKPVSLYINSEGGDVNAALLLYDVIQGLRLPLNIYCMGRAFGMAALLLAGGQKGRRFMLPHSQTMLYKPAMNGGVEGFSGGALDRTENAAKTKALLLEIWVRHTGRTAQEVEEAISREQHMDAEKSVAFGICDDVCTDLA